MAWLGSSGGCAVYYFITSWLVGLSNYLVVCLVCMILVREKKHLLELSKKLLALPGEEGSLSVGPPSRVQVPPALPSSHHRPPCHPGALHQVQVLVSFYFEPSTRSTVVSFGQGVCILSTRFDCQEREKKDFRLQSNFPRDAMYALYILFKLLLRHLLPVVLVLLCLFRPRCHPPK